MDDMEYLINELEKALNSLEKNTDNLIKYKIPDQSNRNLLKSEAKQIKDKLFKIIDNIEISQKK